MGAFGLYLIKVSVCLILFYLFFKVFMSRETFFRFNRFVLLGGIFVCALLPFLRLEMKGEPTFIQGRFLQLEAVFLPPGESVAQYREEGMPVTGEEAIFVSSDEAGKETGVWENVEPYLFAGLYVLGGFAVFVSLFIAYVKMVEIIRSNRKIEWDGYRLVLSRTSVCPFCWGKYIVISENDYENHFDEILMHERMHVMKHHTLDLLIMEFFIVLFWFNPAVWLLKKELQEVHEYEADYGVLNQGIDATKYQLLLVKKAAGARLYSIANSFNHSKLKNRITMMLKEKSNQWARLKVLLFILPTAMLMLAFARPATALLEAGQVSEFKVIQIPEENQFNLQNVEKKVKMESVQDDSTVIVTYSKKIRISKSDSSIVAKNVVVYTRDSQDGKSDSSGVVRFVVSQEKDKARRVRTLPPPPPPAPSVPLVSLMYTEGSGKKVSLRFSSEKEVLEKLNTSDFREATKFVLQVNRQRDDKLQKRIIGLLKEKGAEGDISVKKGTPLPPLAPLRMTFVYNSGQKMHKDVWQISNAESFIDHTPVDRVKEVILNITPKCKDEMKKAIRDYLTEKGFTRISEKQSGND